MSIDEFIKKIVEDVFEDIDASSLKPETKFKELEEWSSLEALCLISIADEDFGVQLNNEDMSQATTIQDIYNIIISRSK